ncbi:MULTISPECIES: glycoside hydrolase family 19 protein [unclassified Janthinobacterium]|uniref:glycoside hydrolase family 19 protein n=1 Tax=unclassified Janthinobacterium TaxID=2610881 RepID=UPI00161C6D72|nr:MULTISPECIES: glycoside hydrolase family 19 protein [unclassified Janthinobacterium]MBB5610528.1 putative chitinase [Janthinobacterium sp. S3T4]MBB5616018.1 putative chitinase [Janthinobacterium sp. S3M3]
MMTLAQLVQIMPYARSRASVFLQPLNAAMLEFGINTPARQASFLAQVGHESGQLLYVRELASGQAYEGRADLGNTQPGDGVRFKGRGLLQVTGRANYTACGKALGLDLLAKPELLEQVVLACRSAGWFWQMRGLNALADTGNQVKVSQRINGGSNGLAARLGLFEVAQRVLA